MSGGAVSCATFAEEGYTGLVGLLDMQVKLSVVYNGITG
jgi:hypothetical protein